MCTLRELGETYETRLFKFFGPVGGVSKGAKFTVCVEKSDSNTAYILYKCNED